MFNIKTDSRKVVEGDTFVALKAVEGDGHNYIKKAIENGAAKIVAEHGEYEVETLIVQDTREYLNEYLKKTYSDILNKLNIIGVTGTNGKTTTAYLIHKALHLSGHRAAYIGTIGFYINDNKICDLPNTTCEISETYEMLIKAYEQNCQTVVLEVSSHGLARKRLEGISYNYAIFTNLTQDHLDFHITMENYALTKQELFKRLKPNGKAIVNTDDSYKHYFLLESNQNITYGFSDANYQVIDYQMNNQCTKFTYQHNNEKYTITSLLLGKYNVYNLLSVIIVLKEMSIEQEKVNKIMPILKAPVGRMEVIKYGTNSIIIDYAHTPDAINNIINVTKEITKGNIYVVFGCTGDRDRTKRPIMTKMVTDLVKRAIITNDDPHNEDPHQIVSDMIKDLDNHNYEIQIDRKKAIIGGIDLLKENDVLLVLGKGHEEVMIIKDQKIPFNDKKTVLEYLKLKNHEPIDC